MATSEIQSHEELQEQTAPVALVAQRELGQPEEPKRLSENVDIGDSGESCADSAFPRIAIDRLFSDREETSFHEPAARRDAPNTDHESARARSAEEAMRLFECPDLRPFRMAGV